MKQNDNKEKVFFHKFTKLLTLIFENLNLSKNMKIDQIYIKIIVLLLKIISEYERAIKKLKNYIKKDKNQDIDHYHI